jgi:DNA-directed RNA polymerase specialized sigma24 family protein
MISDGIENCLMYFRNFDPNKSKNPFAYFTQIIYYAFLRRIQKEKRQLYVKYKATEQFGLFDEFEMFEDDNGHKRQFQLYDNISEFIHTFEESKEKKKKKGKIDELLDLEKENDD